jgi:hypothetical protein
VYAQLSITRHSSLLSQLRYILRANPELVHRGRDSFSQWYTSHVVADYQHKVDSTMPTDDLVPKYRRRQELAATMDRFLRLRTSLRSYLPTIVAMEDGLWQYAVMHWEYVTNGQIPDRTAV